MPENGDKLPELSVVPEDEEPVVTVYRVLTGDISFSVNGGQFGVSDEQLREKGIFFHNETEPPPYRPTADSGNLGAVAWDYYSAGEMDLAEGMVSWEPAPITNLPVFTSFDEARSRLEGQEFAINPPAIAVIKLPLHLLTGPDAEMRLSKTTLHGKSRVLTEFELRQIAKEQKEGHEPFNGQYAIQTAPEVGEIPFSLGDYATFLRPESLTVNKIYTDQPLVQVDLGKK